MTRGVKEYARRASSKSRVRRSRRHQSTVGLKFFRGRADNRSVEESRSKIGAARREERGFTLPEVLITIVILGILLAIASSTWFGVVDSRRVDSAANQLASDMRLAHTRATNQLTEWRVVYSHSSGNYTLVRASDGFTNNRTLEDARVFGSEVGGSGSTIRFKPNGVAEVDGFADADADGEFDITVSTTDGSAQRTMTLNTATSRVELD